MTKSIDCTECGAFVPYGRLSSTCGALLASVGGRPSVATASIDVPGVPPEPYLLPDDDQDETAPIWPALSDPDDDGPLPVITARPYRSAATGDPAASTTMSAGPGAYLPAGLTLSSAMAASGSTADAEAVTPARSATGAIDPARLAEVRLVRRRRGDVGGPRVPAALGTDRSSGPERRFLLRFVPGESDPCHRPRRNDGRPRARDRPDGRALLATVRGRAARARRPPHRARLAVRGRLARCGHRHLPSGSAAAMIVGGVVTMLATRHAEGWTRSSRGRGAKGGARSAPATLHSQRIRAIPSPECMIR